MQLIPKPMKVTPKEGKISYRGICGVEGAEDIRIQKAAEKLPRDETGALLKICAGQGDGEGYNLCLTETEIEIQAEGLRGAFYGIQTLRQIFMNPEISPLVIEDKPDFSYRGFYHDVTRGKVPNVETIKDLIDKMAFFKLNSLQLYVEHTFAFREYADSIERTGCLTAEEIREIDAYCQENFIDFIPSLATFGHLYELLQKPQYRELCVLKEFEPKSHYWHDRMMHHTLDPERPESIQVVQSLIDQYEPLFTSDTFNICCDETFDLEKRDKTGEEYVGFVRKIIDVVQGKGKKVMMWADILLNHPECIDMLPEDICLLNWHYWQNPPEEKVEQIAKSGRAQIVCPGTNTWNRLCENVETERVNIEKMCRYGHQNGAVGVLNTNWGDWGNLCSLEPSMYGLVLGAEKSWNVSTPFDETFDNGVNLLLYENENGVRMIEILSEIHQEIHWTMLAGTYANSFCEEKVNIVYPTEEFIAKAQRGYLQCKEELERDVWKNDEFRQEFLLSAEGICVMAELMAKAQNLNITRLTNTEEWLKRYRTLWLSKNKESELSEIEKVFRYMEEV